MKPYVFTACVVALMVVGCANRQNDLVGAWNGTQVGVTMKMRIEEDKTWKAEMFVRGKQISYAGTWSFAGDTVTLTPQDVAGISVDTLKGQISKMPDSKTKKNLKEMIRPNEFIVSKDGKTLTLKNAAPAHPPMTFSKG